MKRAFVQCAEVVLAPDADPAAPGGAVTLALCGSWDHAGACRWPHETLAGWNEGRGHVRVLFVADPADEENVRTLIGRALDGGECVGPNGKTSRWTATEHVAGVVSKSDADLGARLGAPPHGTV